MEKTYEDIEAEFWSPEKENDAVVGIYLSSEDNVGENKSKVYNLEMPNQKIISVWGSVVLDSKMKLIRFGDDIRIVYLGKVKPSQGREYKDYKIQRVTQAQEPSA